MSKILAAETKPQAAVAPEAAPSPQAPDAIDAAAAWHIQLLSRTDAKLDQFSARLDRVFAEMGRLHPPAPSRELHASLVHRPPSRWPLRLLLVCGLLIAGILNAQALRQWADRSLLAPLSALPSTAALPATPPVVVPEKRVAFMMKAPAALAPQIPVPSPVALLEPPPPAPAPIAALPDPEPVLPAASVAAETETTPPPSTVVHPVDGRIRI